MTEPAINKGGRPPKYPWREMAVGDWHVLPGNKTYIRAAAWQYGRRHGAKFATRYIKLIDRTIVKRLG